MVAGRGQPSDRADAMDRLAAALDSRSKKIAEAVSAQNGMPLAIAEGLEAAFKQMLLRFYGGPIAKGAA